MAGPKQKFFGNLNLDGVKEAVTKLSDKVSDYNGQKQLKISAAQWDDDGISIEVWSKETGSIKLGNLRVSQFKDNGAPAAPVSNDAFKAQDDDLPF